MYSKENWQSMAEKEPPFGYDDNFQTSPSSFYVNDEVSFTVEQTSSTYNRALHMKLERHIAEAPVAKFANPGISRKLDLDDFAPKLKPDSGEMEVIRKFSEVFQITRVGQHSMHQSSTYEFCLAGVTEHLKQFVRESGEFLIIFSYFQNQSWQEKTLKVEREIRKRNDIVERRPLVNFYILVRACLKIVIIPKRWLFFPHTLPIFLGIHQVFLRQIGFVWRKDPSPLGTFPIFKQRLVMQQNYGLR